jgi:hypothetical protein
MTQPLVSSVQGAIGQPASVRVGRIVGVDPLQVSVQGVVFNNVGTIGNLIPFVGMSVQLVGQSTATGSDPTSWVVLGPAAVPFTGPTPPGGPSTPTMDNPPMARLRQTVIQSIPNAASTAVIYDVDDVDTVSGWNGTSGYVAQVAGRYLCSGGASFAANATGVRTWQWAIDGIDQPGTGTLLLAHAASSNRNSPRTDLLYLNAGETLTLTVFQNSGGALNTAVTNVEQATLCVSFMSHS